MATVASSLALHDNMTSVLKTITGAMNMTMSTMHDMQSTMGKAFDTSKMDAARKSIRAAEVAIQSIPAPIEQSTNKQKQFNQQLKNGANSADDLAKKVMGFIAAYASFRTTIGMLSHGFDLFKNFEQSMANVRAITDANEQEFIALRKEAKRLGETTVFSASEAADGMKYLGMAGWNTNSILAGMPGLLNLAAAAGEDLARTADIVSDTMTGFRLSADRANHVADVFAYTATKSNTNVAMMGETMKYVAPVAESFGASIEKTSALIGIMANAGIKASQAGTSLRAGFLRMADPKARAEMSLEQLNVSFTDAKGNMKDINAIVNDLSVAFGRLTDGDKLAAAQRIFGVEAATGWLSIIKEGPAALNEFTKALEGSEGAAAKMAKIMNDTTAGKIKLFLSEIESIWIDFYDGLAAEGVGDAFSAVLDGLAVSLRSILPIFNEIIVGLGNVVMFIQTNWTMIEPIIWGIVAAFGAWLISTNSQAISTGVLAARMAILTAAIFTQTLMTQGLAAAWRTLNAAQRANVFIVLIGAIVALVAWLIQLWKTNDKFAAALMRSWNAILGFFDQVPIFFARVGFGVVNAFMWMKAKSLEILENFINAVIDDINDLIKLLNNIPGVSISAVNHVQFSASAQAEADAMKKAGESVISQMEGEAARKAAEREQNVRNMLQERQAERDKAAKEQKDQADKLKNQNQLNGGISGGKGGTERLKGIDEVGKVKKIEGKVDVASEDLKVMRELAEMKSIQNFVTLTPSVSVGKVDIRNGADEKSFVAHITKELQEQMVTAAQGVYGQ
ncbi:phage tail tape measure protein [Paenibacillus alvei]|uniref:phage tail tape measure protein n=1 Tax=Paenibacillus alvei TaxID=44250 RepID=UPI0013DA9FAA|nr:phage tail tape measure protein [Paenibacillus alvei]MCY9540915.1 phage tail tape measure protein [Paenibacillus alvei]MCY9708181.1 phage tail tape measure protein [Paenibacillus alvei]MEC0080186.1 phage tail tape measure protein [Paenibacillus alvei]